MKKEPGVFNLKKSTLFVFKSKKRKESGLKSDPTNGTATSQTSSVVWPR